MALPCILIVDDDDLVRKVLARVLSRNGCEVVTAGSGDEALAVLAFRPVQLVVSDLRMPSMTGLELMAQVQKRWPQTQRLILTAEYDDELMRAFETGQVHRSLAKPWENQALLNLIAQMLSEAEGTPSEDQRACR